MTLRTAFARTDSAFNPPVPARTRSIELRAVPRPATPQAPRRLASDLYPEHASDIVALKRVGIASVHGFFPLPRWEATCAATKLYMLPMSGTAKGRLGEIHSTIHHRRMRLSAIGRIMESEQTTAVKVLNEMSRKGELLPTIWPGYREATDRWHDIGFDYPQPPADVVALAQKAQLAGYAPMIAVPGHAIKVNDLSSIVSTEPQRAPDRIDPIVYAVKGNTAVVLTHYGEIEAGAMATLVEVLTAMDVQL